VGAARKRPATALAPVVTLDRTETPKSFFESVDWEAWFHDFATATVRGGAPKYTSTFAFAQANGKTRLQRDTILYVIGPKVNRPSSTTAPYSGLDQFEWDKRRKAGFWLGPEPLKEQIEKIVAQTDTLTELRSSAQVYLLPLIAKLAGMMDKIESSFSGQLFMPGLSTKENEARAELYMRLTDHVTTGMIRLQEAYARSLMLNISDLLGTIAVQQHVSSKIQTEGTKSNATLGKIIEMMADKGQALRLPLPDADIMHVVQQKVS
jgi:hypothetical protein